MSSRPITGRICIAATAVVLAFAQGAAAQVPAAPMGPLEEASGWALVSFSDGMSVYMRRPDPQAKDGIRQIWTAYDSEEPRDRDGFAFMSVASLGEYDCAKRMTRVMRETFHEKPGLTGKTWSAPEFTPTDWAAPTSGTVGHARMEFACPSKAA